MKSIRLKSTENKEKCGTERSGHEEAGCPATRTIEVIGGRWKLSLLYYLSGGVQRYSDLQRCLPAITPKMLTQQLRELERDGVVHREVYRQVPPKVEYSLTPLGESLRPVISAITEWGERFAQRP